MRTIWKGSLSFGLVSIPVELYSAVQQHSFGFNMLHNTCHTPLEYERWCPHCEKEIPWQDVVKGLKVQDRYIVLTPETLKKLKPEKTDLISIVQCVNPADIEFIYFNQHYYCLPSKALTDKAYYLFVEALNSTQKVAIARLVMKDKEHMCVIQPYHNGLLLTTLHYSYEIRDLKKLDQISKKRIATNAQELALAKQFITQLTKKNFSMQPFKDSFAEKLRRSIVQLQKGAKTPKTIKAAKTNVGQHKPTLMGQLKASIAKPKPRTKRAR